MADEALPGSGGPAPAVTDATQADDDRTAAAESPDTAALKHERDDLYDRLLRKTAEFDNYRKRVERERREQADQAVVDLLQDLLLVVDDFDRALDGRGGRRREELSQGRRADPRKLHDLLRKHGVRPIEALGADFDPNLHQAVVHERAPSIARARSSAKCRRGYMLGDRLLRPAMVKVAKA